MNQPSTLPSPNSPSFSPTSSPSGHSPQAGMAPYPGVGQPLAPHHFGPPQVAGPHPGATPVHGHVYPAQPYPQPINIVVQNTNTMEQNVGPVRGGLVRVASRNKWVAAALAFFLGGFGVHKFYLGQTGMGVVYLLFCWTFIPLLASLVETLMLVVADEREFDVRFNSRLL